MIKCFWFWKLLKQLFIIWLISCFGLLANSFVNAWYSRQIWVYGFQPYDESVNINVITKWTLNSELIWEVKKIFWFNEWNYFMRDYSFDLWWVSMYAVNQIFGSNGYYLNQGFISDYLICNKTITWVSLDWSISSNYYTGCTKYTISNWNLQTIKNFVDSIKSTDYYWFDFYSSTACTQAVLCFSSQQYWKSLCFWNSIKWTTSIYNDCYPYFFLDYWVYNWWNTVYSKSYWTGWGSVNAYYSSPAVNNQGQSWNWTVWDNVNGNIQWFSTGGNITYECTNKKALEYYNSVWLSKNLCFWWLDNYNTWNLTIPTPWTWKDILDIWAETALINGETYGYEEWFSYYRNAYNNLNMVALSNPFTWKPDVLQSLFRMIDTYGASVSDRVIIEYCDLLLYKSLTWTYNWILGNEPCSVNWQNSIDYYYNYWSGYTTIIGNNVFDWTWEVITDWSVFMETFINKLKTQFVIDRSDTWLGVIPRYIISFMVLLALFRFISH